MCIRDRVRSEFVQQWLDKAAGDVRAARILLTAGADLSSGAAFHAQQAAEKYLKAVLVRHQVDFPRTHDLERLVDLVRTIDSSLATVLASAAVLTPYGVEARYPADLPEPTHAEATEAFGIAEDIERAVLGHLSRE